VCPFHCGATFVGDSVEEMSSHLQVCTANPVPRAARTRDRRRPSLRSALQSRGNASVPNGSVALIDGGRSVRFVPMFAHRVPPSLIAQAANGELELEAMEQLLAAMLPGVDLGEFPGMEAPQRGAAAGVLSSLPTTSYSAAKATHTQCCICLMDYEEGEQIVTLPCLHPFHQECAMRWLERSTKCPVCKHDVESVAGGAAARS